MRSGWFMRAVPDSIPDKKSSRRANVKDGWDFSR
jgi:hypothetical protein